MVSIGEALVIEGLVPDDFKEFFNRWSEPEVGKASNNVIKEVESIDRVEGFEVVKVTINTPWPIWNRVIISTFYPHHENDSGEVIHLFSC